jgi:hypothetical protein
MKPTLHLARRLLLVAVLGTVAVASQGCLNRYKVTLISGNVITTHGRPKYDKATDTFRFKDAEGKPRTIPSIRVKEIEPL